MELDNLNLFIEVMRQGSFADVARARGVAPSSISRAIANLERELGVRLFQRNTRNLEPTEAAVVYFDRIHPAVADIDAARHEAVDISAEPKGTLRLTAATVFGQTMLAPLLPELSTLYPQLAVELLLTDAYLDLVEERIDIAIRLGSLQDSAYVARRLAAMRFYICASPAYLQRRGTPQTPGDIAGHDCLLFPRQGYKLDWLFRDAQGSVTRVAIGGRFLITNSAAILHCTLAGMGLALLPDWLVNNSLASGELVALFPDHAVSATDFNSAVWILYPSRAYLPLKSRVMIDFLLRHFGGTQDGDPTQ